MRRSGGGVGGFIGVQAMPVPRRMFHEYDALIEAGTDHFSFCYEFEDPEVFARICPGKEETLGQQAFFEAMEYTAKKLGRGRVSGEIIAGLEPIEATKRGIDRIVERRRISDRLHLPAHRSAASSRTRSASGSRRR